MKKENSISRRSFLKSSALAGALGAIEQVVQLVY